MEPTSAGPAPAVDATAPPKEVLDALSGVVGAGKARAVRVGVAFAMAALAHNHLPIPAAWSGPIVDQVVTGAVTALVAGLGKTLRDHSITLGPKTWQLPWWIPKLPGWFPI